MKKIKQSFFMMIILIGVLLVTDSNASAKYENDRADIYKRVQVTESVPMIPDDYEYVDYYDLAKRYNEMIFDFDNYEIGFIDKSYLNVKTKALGMKSTPTKSQDIETSEAINVLAALLSATHVMPDNVTSEQLEKYLLYIQTYYNIENGEGLVLNNPVSDTSELSFWEAIYPGVLYFMLMSKYDSTADSDDILKNTADSWYNVIMQLGGKDKTLDVSYTGYDFVTNEPFDNGEWVEPDAAAGMALIQYYAYEMFEDKKYLEATKLCMTYAESFLRHPGYEMLYLYLPYLSARLNSLEGQSYDTSKYMDWFFNVSDARQNYGMFTDVGTGLIGDTVKYGGSADAFSSIVGAITLPSMLKYDQRYAVEVGRYLLHFTNNYKYFYSNYLEDDMQSEKELSTEYQNLIPYENLNITADYKYGFYEPSLVAGSFIGMLGAMIEETNIEGILKVDLNVNDYYTDDPFSYLLFNPHDEKKTVNYAIKSDGLVTLYDTISQSILYEFVEGSVDIEIDPSEAVIITEIVVPDEHYEYEIKRELENNIKAKRYIGVNIAGLSEYEPLVDNQLLELDMQTTQGVAITNIEIYLDEAQVFKNVTYETPYEIEIDDLVGGYHLVKVVVYSNTGLKDTAYARVFVQKDEDEPPLDVKGVDVLEWETYEQGEVTESKGKSVVSIKGQGGVKSETFELDFSKVPLLTINVPTYTNKWSMFLEVPEIDEVFYLVKDSEIAGDIHLSMKYVLQQLNPRSFSLNGMHDVSLGFELDEGEELLFQNMKIIYENRQPLSYREWSIPLSTKNLIRFQSKFNALGKLNYYDGVAKIKNLNKEGSGGIETYYFTVDFEHEPDFTISIDETEGLWSVLMYVEGETESYYVQYPTDETGTFTYRLNDVIERVGLELEDETERDIYFYIRTDGEYGSTLKLDYMTLRYEMPWYVFSSVSFVTLLIVAGIFKNIHRRF